MNKYNFLSDCCVEGISFLRSNLDLDSEVSNHIIFVKNTCESLLGVDPVSTCITICSLFKENQYFSQVMTT